MLCFVLLRRGGRWPGGALEASGAVERQPRGSALPPAHAKLTRKRARKQKQKTKNVHKAHEGAQTRPNWRDSETEKEERRAGRRRRRRELQAATLKFADADESKL